MHVRHSLVNKKNTTKEDLRQLMCSLDHLDVKSRPVVTKSHLSSLGVISNTYPSIVLLTFKEPIRARREYGDPLVPNSSQPYLRHSGHLEGVNIYFGSEHNLPAYW